MKGMLNDMLAFENEKKNKFNCYRDEKACIFIPKEKEFEEFVRFYDGSSHRIFLDSIQKQYRFLGFGETNPIMEIDNVTFRKLAFTISAWKYDDSETTDFEGFLKIKKSFTAKSEVESLGML